MAQVKFYRGDFTNYTKENITDYENSIYFDTTNHVIYLNGQEYGVTEAIQDVLGSGIVTNVELTVADNDGPSLTVSKSDGAGKITATTIPLFTIVGKDAVKVTWDADKNKYETSLTLEENRGTDANQYNILSQSSNGLWANITLEKDSATSATAFQLKSGTKVLGEISIAEITKDKFLKSGSVVEFKKDTTENWIAPIPPASITTPGTYLHLVLATTANSTETGTQDVYINVNDLVTQYVAGKGITIDDSDPLSNSDDVSIGINLQTSKYLVFNTSGQLQFNDNDLDTNITDASNNAYNRAHTEITALTNTVTGIQTSINNMDANVGDADKILVTITETDGKLTNYVSKFIGEMTLGSYTAPTDGNTKITTASTLKDTISALDSSIVQSNSRISSLEGISISLSGKGGENFGFTKNGNTYTGSISTNTLSLNDDDKALDMTGSVFDGTSIIHLSDALRATDDSISWHTLTSK
jgi:hypothetical protein